MKSILLDWSTTVPCDDPSGGETEGVEMLEESRGRELAERERNLAIAQGKLVDEL